LYHTGAFFSTLPKTTNRLGKLGSSQGFLYFLRPRKTLAGMVEIARGEQLRIQHFPLIDFI